MLALKASIISESPKKYNIINRTNRIVYPRNKLLAEISLQIPPNILRKRPSNKIIKNNTKRRIKPANTLTEKGIVDLLKIKINILDKGININNTIAKIERLIKERLKIEKQVKKDKKRVEKSVKSKRFRDYYIYKE